MANIEAYISDIMNAQYGEDVRAAIMSALTEVNNDVTSKLSKINEVVENIVVIQTQMGFKTSVSNKNGNVWEQLNWVKDTIGDPNTTAKVTEPTIWSNIHQINKYIGEPDMTGDDDGLELYARVNWLLDKYKKEEEKGDSNTNK